MMRIRIKAATKYQMKNSCCLFSMKLLLSPHEPLLVAKLPGRSPRTLHGPLDSPRVISSPPSDTSPKNAQLKNPPDSSRPPSRFPPTPPPPATPRHRPDSDLKKIL